MGNDLLWGLGMMGVGMGVVFALLLVLMGLLLLIGALDRPRAAAAAPAAAPAPSERDEDTLRTREGGDGDAVTAPAGVQILHDGLTADQMTAIALAVITHAHVRRAQAAPEVRAFAPGSNLHASRWVQAGRTGQNAAWRRK